MLEQGSRECEFWAIKCGLINVPNLQRPSAKELMRHTFIRKAKKNSYLMDLIDRYKKWRLTRGDDSETDSGGESGGDNAGDDSDTDWNMTVKGPPPPSYTDSLGYSQPINSVGNSDRISNGDSSSRDISPPRAERSSRSRSPEKQIAPSGLSPAKSEQQIVSRESPCLAPGITFMSLAGQFH